MDLLTATTASVQSTIISENAIDIIVSMLLGILLGVCLSVSYAVCNKRTYSRIFAISIVLLPSLCAAVIWLIGNDLTRAISLGGLFALVRFRSVPGDSKDITVVLAAMAAGLAIALDYYEASVAITVIYVVVYVALTYTPYASRGEEQQLRITIPENLDYDGVFDEILKKYATDYSIEEIRTVRMGTMFDLTYRINLKKGVHTKEMIDELRVKNGNLDIILNTTPKEKGAKVL